MSHCKIQTSNNLRNDYFEQKLQEAVNQARMSMQGYDSQGDYETARMIERDIITAEDMLRGDCKCERQDIILQTKKLLEV